MKGFGNVQTVEQNGGVALSRVAIILRDHAFEFAKPHAVFIGHVGLCVKLVTLGERRPKRAVAHNHGIDHAVRVERELILAQHAEPLRAGDVAFLKLKLACEQLHKGGLARAVWPGQSVAPPRLECNGDVFEQNLSAVAHAYIGY